MNASAISTLPAAACNCAASSAVSAIGFSHSTCLPAAAARSVQGTCRWFGSGLYTASISGSASSASYEP